jgi:hypothetical protein
LGRVVVLFILADSRRFLFRNVENKPSLETWAVTVDCTATNYEPKVSILLSHKASVATLPKTSVALQRNVSVFLPWGVLLLVG